MAAKGIEGSPEDWARVGKAVGGRRLELGILQREVQARSGNRLSQAVWSAVENGHPNNNTIARRSAVGICEALGWRLDSIERLLAGQEPLLAGEEAPSSVRGDLEERLRVVEDRTEELHAAVQQMRRDMRPQRRR